MARTPPTIPNHSDAKETRLQAAIAGDDSTWEAPKGAEVRRRGRPVGSNKEQVTVKLDRDVVAALKGTESKGWQTRMNTTLRDALKLKNRDALKVTKRRATKVNKREKVGM